MQDKIKQVLEFYAQAKHYEFNADPWARHDSAIAADGGRLARELLAELETEPDG